MALFKRLLPNDSCSPLNESHSMRHSQRLSSFADLETAKLETSRDLLNFRMTSMCSTFTLLCENIGQINQLQSGCKVRRQIKI